MSTTCSLAITTVFSLQIQKRIDKDEHVRSETSDAHYQASKELRSIQSARQITSKLTTSAESHQSAQIEEMEVASEE
jgi:hypothetical protein